MIFHKTLLRELTSTAFATFLVLLGIVLTTQLVRLLGQAAGGVITSTSVIALLGFTALSYLPTLLSLTLFISVLMSISRAYRDSEMVVWFACANLFVMGYEEPTLRRQFGAEYDAYCRQVGRWIPRLLPANHPAG